METHRFYSEWYRQNRERLLPIRRKYNAEYTKRPEVIERARIKNATPEARRRRALYKKTHAGKVAEKRYKMKNKLDIKLKAQRTRLKGRYGLTPEKLDEMLLGQNAMCLICRSDISKKFHIDHCHKTGAVRGLLCTPCNLGLGLFKDDCELLQRAIEYLK